MKVNIKKIEEYQSIIHKLHLQKISDPEKICRHIFTIHTNDITRNLQDWVVSFGIFNNSKKCWRDVLIKQLNNKISLSDLLNEISKTPNDQLDTNDDFHAMLIAFFSYYQGMIPSEHQNFKVIFHLIEKRKNHKDIEFLLSSVSSSKNSRDDAYEAKMQSNALKSFRKMDITTISANDLCKIRSFAIENLKLISQFRDRTGISETLETLIHVGIPQENLLEIINHISCKDFNSPPIENLALSGCSQITLSDPHIIGKLIEYVEYEHSFRQERYKSKYTFSAQKLAYLLLCTYKIHEKEQPKVIDTVLSFILRYTNGFIPIVDSFVTSAKSSNDQLKKFINSLYHRLGYCREDASQILRNLLLSESGKNEAFYILFNVLSESSELNSSLSMIKYPALSGFTLPPKHYQAAIIFLLNYIENGEQAQCNAAYYMLRTMHIPQEYKIKVLEVLNQAATRVTSYDQQCSINEIFSKSDMPAKFTNLDTPVKAKVIDWLKFDENFFHEDQLTYRHKALRFTHIPETELPEIIKKLTEILRNQCRNREGERIRLDICETLGIICPSEGAFVSTVANALWNCILCGTQDMRGYITHQDKEEASAVLIKFPITGENVNITLSNLDRIMQFPYTECRAPADYLANSMKVSAINIDETIKKLSESALAPISKYNEHTKKFACLLLGSVNVPTTKLADIINTLIKISDEVPVEANKSITRLLQPLALDEKIMFSSIIRENRLKHPHLYPPIKSIENLIHSQQMFQTNAENLAQPVIQKIFSYN